MDEPCGAHLYIADDYGDGAGTVECQRPKGHPGRHLEQFPREGGQVEITWVKDEREVCIGCGVYCEPHEAHSCCRCGKSICEKCRMKAKLPGLRCLASVCKDETACAGRKKP